VIIRSFVAETPEDAYQMARRSLGPEAIILSTSKKRTGNLLTRWFRAPVVEVVAGKPRTRQDTGTFRAAPSKPPVSQPPPSASSAPPRQRATSPGRLPGPLAVLPAEGGPAIPAEVAPVDVCPPLADPVEPAAPAPVVEPPSAPPAIACGRPPAGPVAPVPASPPSPDPLHQEVLDLKAQMAELSDLKDMLRRVLETSPASEVTPAPVAPEAVRAIESMRPAEKLPAMVRGVLEGLKRSQVDGVLRQQVKDGLLGSLSPEELQDPGKIYEATVALISKRIQVGPGLDVLARQHDRPLLLALVGPTGVGKTTTLAKLAAGFQFQHGLKAAFVTLDTYRIAAPEQLKQYAEIIDIPIKVAFKAEDLQGHVRSFRDRDVILVDTVGRSHRNADDIEDLKGYLEVLEDAEVFLVLSANTKYQDLREALDVFREMGVSGLVMTKLDETSSYGDMVSLMAREKLPVHFVTNGQSVPDDIQRASPEDLARLVTPTPPRSRRKPKAGERRSRLEAVGPGEMPVAI